MRTRVGRLRGPLLHAMAWLLFALPAAALGQTPTPTPTPTPVPGAGGVPDGEMPTIAEDAGDDGDGDTGSLGTDGDEDDEEAESVGDEESEEEWDNRSSASGMILGMRGGVHAYEVGGLVDDGGVGLEFVGAMPIHGPFYAGGAAGYHTGYVEAGADGESRFFDAQYFSLEGQYRRNIGRLNMTGGVGIGYLTANSAMVEAPEGSEEANDSIEVSGSTVAVHVVTAAHYPIAGSFGLVAQVKYALAPVNFTKIEETISMGGLTVGVGMDFGF